MKNYLESFVARIEKKFAKHFLVRVCFLKKISQKKKKFVMILVCFIILREIVIIYLQSCITAADARLPCCSRNVKDNWCSLYLAMT